MTKKIIKEIIKEIIINLWILTRVIILIPIIILKNILFYAFMGVNFLRHILRINRKKVNKNE